MSAFDCATVACLQCVSCSVSYENKHQQLSTHQT